MSAAEVLSSQPVGSSENEIVSECCSVIDTIQSEMTSILRNPLITTMASSQSATLHKWSLDDCPISPNDVSTNPLDTVSHSSDPVDGDVGAMMNGLDGESVNAQLAHLGRRVDAVRRQFFDVQQRLSHPRLFLIPDVDEKGMCVCLTLSPRSYAIGHDSDIALHFISLRPSSPD